MATAHIKKVIKIGGSLAIILPTEWTKGNVEAGQEMVVVGNGELHIFPVHAKVSQQDIKDEAEDA
jgi:antitoxin component of MazEF toxin-antitoxin module